MGNGALPTAQAIAPGPIAGTLNFILFFANLTPCFHDQGTKGGETNLSFSAKSNTERP
jgi:hypothetical protein